MSPNRSIVILFAVTAILSAAVAVRVPLTYPATGYFPQAVEWATSGHITNTFTPDAEPLFLGLAYRLGGFPGVLALNVLLQIALAGVCYWILRVLGLPPGWSAFGSLPVAINPEFILSVSKVWDLTLSAFLLLLFVLCCLNLARSAPQLSMKITAATGLASAAAVFSRPNLILLLPVVLMAALHGRANISRGKLGGHLAAFLVIVAAGYSFLCIVSHGSVFFPTNGPYNLYAGHNPLTETALVDHLNAEFSLPTLFTASHPGAPISDLYDPGMGSYFLRQSILFARQHPAEEIKLFFLKIFTLFRPDTKVHSLSTLPGLVKGIFALPVFLLLGALFLPNRPALSFEDYVLFAVELLYILPFLLTNSDPRFRISLDALLLLHLVSLVYRRRSSRLARTSAALPQIV
jgi:hypothetical protein